MPTVLPSSLITGYYLQMDDGYGGQFSTIYDGQANNAQLFHLQTNLTTGLLYTFRVYAINFNGDSEASALASYYVCMAPSEFAGPTIRT